MPRSSDDSSLPFEADESLVSSVIQLDCDDPKGVNSSGITVALSHSAPDLGGYELVMKELRIDSGKKTWKELKPTNEICVPPGMLLLIYQIKNPKLWVFQDTIIKVRVS